MKEQLEIVLAGLMDRYKERVPDVQRVINAMLDKGLIFDESEIENDHIAFRTMGVPQLGIKSFEKIFTAYGYKKMDYFFFEQKKLNAFWYSPPEGNYPRIFVSELRVEDFDQKFQDIIYKYTNEVKSDPVDSLDLKNAKAVDEFLHSPLWQTPTWEDYAYLQEHSEYAAWVIYNRYYLNHFTVSVHNLPEGYDTVENFNKFLEAIPVKLNNAGGKIKISPDGKLIQSSTVAEIINAKFPHADGTKHFHEISGSYVEFAERRVLDQYANLPKEQITREHRRDGFEAGNADKIFESTFSSQTKIGS
jgi:hypothetical protein